MIVGVIGDIDISLFETVFGIPYELFRCEDPGFVTECLGHVLGPYIDPTDRGMTTDDRVTWMVSQDPSDDLVGFGSSSNVELILSVTYDRN